MESDVGRHRTKRVSFSNRFAPDERQLRNAMSVPFLRQSLSALQPVNLSSAPPRKSALYFASTLLQYIGVFAIIYISTLYLDTATGPGRMLMAAIVLCCCTLTVADYYFTQHKVLSSAEERLQWVLWPAIFSVLFALAGVSLETGFGLFNELYIMLYCLVVTMTAFLISLRKNSMSLSVIALFAGISIPFIIEDAYETSTSVYFSFIVIIASIVLYLYHGWALLLISSGFAFWGSMHLHNLLSLSRRDTDTIRAAIFLQWIAFWIGSMIKERFLTPTGDTSRFPKKRLDSGSLTQFFYYPSQQRKLIWFNLFILLACTHLLASTYFSVVYWAPWAINQGMIYLVASFVFALWERKHPPGKYMSLFYPNYVMSVLLLTIGIYLGLYGDIKYTALAIEATVIVLVSNNMKDHIGMSFGILMWIVVLIYSGFTLIATEPEIAVLNRDALFQLAVIILLAFQAHMLEGVVALKLLIEGIVHAYLTMWLYREFAHTHNYLYVVTALYPAGLQYYAYFKGDSAKVTFIRMIFGDLLWLWFFIAQTLPRLILAHYALPSSFFPFVSVVGSVDILVNCVALQSALLQECRFQGTTRWLYLTILNATWISLIFREAHAFQLVFPLLCLYIGGVVLVGLFMDSFNLKLGGLLTFFVLFCDDVIDMNVDVLWKGTLAMFAGTLALAIVLPNPWENKDPIDQRAMLLSRTGAFDLGKMSFSGSPKPVSRTKKRRASASPNSPAHRVLQSSRSRVDFKNIPINIS